MVLETPIATKISNPMETKSTPNRNCKHDIQSSFLASVRSRVPFNLSFPDELAELLNISRDSAYRRIREETILSLQEARILCDRYNVSIDSLFAHDSGKVSFDFRAQDGSGLVLQSWLETMLTNLETLEATAGADLIWYSKDLPIFHFFQIPRLAAFRLFFWMKLSGDGQIGREKYDERAVGSKLIALGEKIWARYSRVPSTEIISRELLNTTLRQVEYAYEIGLLDKNKAVELCGDCGAMIEQLQRQAQHGLKQIENQSSLGRFDVYLNELQIGDDTILFRTGDKRSTFVTHNNFNILSTSHDALCQQTEQYMNSVIRKSLLISKVAEKERMKFFNRIQKQVDELRGVVGG